MKLVDIQKIDQIVSSDNFNNFLTLDAGDSFDSPDISGVKRNDIPVDISPLKHLRIVEVQPNTNIPAHAHPGPVLRVILKGEAVVNGKTYSAGDWMAIPSNHKYSISTTMGYTASWSCQKCIIFPKP